MNSSAYGKAAWRKGKYDYMENLLKVGTITTTHGIRGEVKVFPTTDEGRFEELDFVFLDTGRDKIRLEIENVRYMKNLVLLKFKGFDQINDVEKYKGKDLWIPREEAQPLADDEYYVADLIDMEVLTEDGAFFGRIRDVLHTGANDVYTVIRETGEEVLLPAIHDCVKKVDVENKKMWVHLMKGLLS